MRRLASLAGLALMFMSRASAQTSLPLELDWRAPAECPSAWAVRDELARVTRVRAGVTLQPLLARVNVQRSGATYVAVLRTEHERRAGERRLEADSCETLVRSVTLVLALAFGSGVEVSDAHDSPAPPPAAGHPLEAEPRATENPTALTPEVPDASSTPTVPEAADDRPSQRWNVSLTGGAQFGLFPATAFAASVGAEREATHSSLAVRVQFWPGVSDEVRTERAGRVEAHYAALGLALRACPTLTLSTATLALCGTFGVAAMRGTTTEATRVESRASIAPWYTGELGAALDWPRARRLRLRLEASLTASLNRPEFAIEGAGTAYHVPRFVPLVAAGLVLTL